MSLVVSSRHRLKRRLSSVRECAWDLAGVLGLGVLRQMLLRVRAKDLLGLAGQLAYFFLLSFFPFLICLVAGAGLVLNEPERIVTSLVGDAAGFLPGEAAGLISDYTSRTLRSTGPSVLFFGVIITLWLGSAAAIAISKAANWAYGVAESRSFLKLRGTSVLLAMGFTFLVAALVLLVFKVDVLIQGTNVLSTEKTFVSIWSVSRWVLAFLTITFALSILYYLAPNARLPFRWITPGGLVATILMFLASVVLSFYVSHLGSYDQVYGQLATVVVVFMI